eukprot:1760786-Rhodomonas_salina.2
MSWKGQRLSCRALAAACLSHPEIAPAAALGRSARPCRPSSLTPLRQHRCSVRARVLVTCLMPTTLLVRRAEREARGMEREARGGRWEARRKEREARGVKGERLLWYLPRHGPMCLT